MTSLIQAGDPKRSPAIPDRENQHQIAALCLRGSGKKRRVLLITSRDTGRWVLPKGWPIDGLDGPGTAAQEAWEEAGVKPVKVKKRPVGSFQYLKRMSADLAVIVQTQVYKIRVASLAETFPEAGERIRKWVTPDKAAMMVEEPGLREILRNL